jgi:lipopolysaccharide exporter
MSLQPRSILSGLFSKEGFRGPVLTLMSGSAVALLASYLAQPILTRLFTPEAFGLADYFIGLMTVFITVASLRYEDALMTPDSRRSAADVWWLCLVLTGFVSALLLVLIPFRHELASLLGNPLFAPFIILLGPTLLVMRISRLSDLWLARERRFRVVSAGDVANKLSMTGIRLGTSPFGAAGLIGGFIVGNVISAAVYVTTMFRLRLLPGPPPSQRLRATATRFRRYALFSAPSALLNAVVARLPILLLPFFFAFEVVGQFGRAFIVLAVPMGVIGGAIAQVFFVAAGEANRTGDLPRLAGAVHARLVMLGMFPTIALMVAGPDLFAFVLGEPWREAGVFVRYVGLWLFLGGVAAPLTRLFDILERQRADLVTALAMFVLLLSAMLYGGFSGDVMLTIMLLGAAGVVARGIQIVIAMRLAQTSMSAVASSYLRYAAMSLPGVALLAVVARYEMPLATFLAAVAGGIMYLGLIWYFDRPLAGGSSEN